ncbi:uncharacterized protein LOC111241600 [Vigna radiata var. radiata]|uniref:Uncharacterized protein LOC111241600 n=1 Tax=Vigna radiata var. radiata TaxID=3916 RepID=A0A3Q0EXW2_VIGRR|nr:uncharacterized protein LOC111241600 [Vigna radiata var. radiata]
MDHLSGDEYVEEEEEIGFGLEDSDEEYRTEVNCRGLPDDEWHSDVLVSPQNSGSENESEDRPQPGPFQTYEKQKSMTDYKWKVGTVFADKAHFIEAIRTYVVHIGRALKFVKNDKRRVRVRCMGGQGKCPWTTYCGYLPSRQFWQLRKIKDTHICSRQLNIKILNTKWLSEEIDRCLQDNPNLKVQDIRKKALRKWNTKISISKARRAKLMATRQLIGDFKEQYRRIHDYGHELLRSNPGSTV